MKTKTKSCSIVLALTTIVLFLILISSTASADSVQSSSTGEAYAYITNYDSNTISVVNVTTNTVTATVNVGIKPSGIAVNSIGTKVYVTNYGSNTVSVIDTDTNTVTATVDVGLNPYGIIITSDGTKVYVTNYHSNTISVIDAATNNIIATVNVGLNPYGVVVYDESEVYVTNYGDSTVSAINITTNTITATVSVGAYPYGLAVSPDGKKVYVVNAGNNNVSVIDTATENVTATVKVGTYPYGIILNPTGTKAYVTNSYSDTVSVINTENNTVIATLDVGPYPVGIVINPAGTKLYVAHDHSDIFSIINTNTNNILLHVNYGTDPFALGKFIGLLPVQVYPVANFNTNVTSGYAPLSVQFNDLSENANAWNWDFGDGVNSTDQNPTHIFSAAGNYTINLTASNGNGTSSKLGAITVLEQEQPMYPLANFNTNVTNGYAPLSVQFNDLSENANARNWDFGDGVNSTDQNPTHTFFAAGNYTINLTASNGNDTSSKLGTITVLEQEQPVPAYTIDKKVTDVIGKGSTEKITKAGDGVTYQIDVNNTGNVNLTNVKVNDPLINLAGPVESLNANGVLEVGETWTYTGTYTVTQGDINSNGGEDGFISNMATVTSDQLGPKSDSAEVPIKEEPSEITPSYCIYKSIIGADENGDCIVNSPRDVIHYRIVVKNDGNVDLTGVSVNDPMIILTGPIGDDNDPRVLNPGETWVYTGDYALTQADINNKEYIDNTATVSSNELPSKSFSVSQLIDKNADLSIQMSTIGIDEAGDKMIDELGDIINYQVAVKNNGDISLTGVLVNDPMVKLTRSGDNGGSGLLEPGKTWVYKGNYIVTQADIDNVLGIIENTATVSCDQLSDKSSSIVLPISRILSVTSGSENSTVLPVANFSTNATSGYTPLSVQFTDLSQNTTSRSWNFNNDGIADSSDMSPVYTYTAPGTYITNLTVSNANGTDSKIATINVLQTISSNGGGSSGSSSSGADSFRKARIVSSNNDISSSSDNTNATGNATQPENNTLGLKQNNGTTAANVKQTPEQTQNTSTPARESKNTPGFEIFSGITALLAVILYRRR